MWQPNQAERAFSIGLAGLPEDAMLTPSANLHMFITTPLVNPCFAPIAHSKEEAVQPGRTLPI